MPTAAAMARPVSIKIGVVFFMSMQFPKEPLRMRKPLPKSQVSALIGLLPEFRKELRRIFRLRQAKINPNQLFARS
jgi:hypothetical protein